LFGNGREGLEGGDDFLADAFVARLQIGKFELLGKGDLDVALGQQAKLDRSVAETQAFFHLQRDDAFGRFGTQAPLIDQDAADRATGNHGAKGIGDDVHI
jgi:hypothetical protein